MNSATPQDTFDHTFGTGCLIHEWWLSTRVVKGVHDSEVSDDWEIAVIADDGNECEANKLVNHKVIMTAARAIMSAKDADFNGTGKYLSKSVKRECRNLVFDAYDADFDAETGDQLLQVVVLGEIIFG